LGALISITFLILSVLLTYSDENNNANVASNTTLLFKVAFGECSIRIFAKFQADPYYEPLPIMVHDDCEPTHATSKQRNRTARPSYIDDHLKSEIPKMRCCQPISISNQLLERLFLPYVPSYRNISGAQFLAMVSTRLCLHVYQVWCQEVLPLTSNSEALQ